MSNEETKFEGWAIVELLGHRREMGYVTTEHYGAASLFRVDRPELTEREFELERPEYIDGRMNGKGTKVQRQGAPAKSVLVGPGSIYALNPCTEETVRAAIDSATPRALIVLNYVPPKFIGSVAGDPFDDSDHEEELP